MNNRLVEKFLESQCTAEEARKVLEWFQTPEGQQYLDEEIDSDIRAYYEFGEYFESPDVRSEQLFSRIQQSVSRNRVQNSARDYKTGWKKAAAVILLATVLSVFAGVYLYDWGADTKIVKTEQGEKKTLFLPDSSKVILHSNSSIEYLSSFNQREVVLEGEAYFEVEHEDNNPFMVLKGNSYVKVLGTVFTIGVDSSSKKIKVAVRQGKVELGKIDLEDGLSTVAKLNSVEPQIVGGEDNKQLSTDKSNRQKESSIKISKHQVGTMDENGTVSLIKDPIYSKSSFDWVFGKITFRKTPLSEVIDELEDRYGIECVLTDSTLTSKELTTSFDSESLDEVLRVLALSLDIRYNKSGSKVYFSDGN